MSALQLGALLGTGNEAEVFDAGDVVVKLYKDPGKQAAAEREAAKLRLVAALGLPVPACFGVEWFGDRWGVIMAKVSGAPFAEVMLADAAVIPAYLAVLARWHEQVHKQPAGDLPRQADRLAANIARAPGLAEATRQRLLTDLAEQPAGNRLCHGDYHPFNVLGALDAPTIVDWVDASAGDPAADVARSLVLLWPNWPQFAQGYRAAYCAQTGLDGAQIDRWLPMVAAASLAENVTEAERSVLHQLVPEASGHG